MPTQKDLKNVASCLKHLKPLLDDVVDSKIPSDESVCKECEELDAAVNEAREFLEKWSPKMSKILCVLQSDQLVEKIQSLSLEVSHNVHKLLESSTSTSCLSEVQHCMQEFHYLKLEKLSEHIEEALESQKHGEFPQAEDLKTIIESLKFASKHELLNERISLEKERIKAENNNLKRNLDRINHIVDLVSNIRDYMTQLGNVNTIDGIQIPSHFRCPLSLELMLNPVVTPSGQTYERASIQKWLDNGLNMCPTTHQKFSHTNLIPNHRVRDQVANWCEANRVKLHKDSECLNGVSYQSQSAFTAHEKPRNFTSVSNNSENFAHSSPDQVYSPSRSESTSSAVSSIDYMPAVSTDALRRLSKLDNASNTSGDIMSDSRASSFNKYSDFSPLCGRPHSSKTLGAHGNHNFSRGISFQSESSSNELTTASHVEQLVEDLKSQSIEAQTSAAAELRFLAKHNMENRVIIGHCGAIAPLISLLHSDVEMTQEHAVTALLNLSINESIKAKIAEERALEPLIHVLKTGNAGAKENAAATLFSLSLIDEYRIKIGSSNAVKALVELLRSGTIRGKKDAATALFNLSIFHGNKARIVQAGAVKCLIELMDPEKEMVDKSVALLANLSTISEGCLAIAKGGGIPALVEIVETGSQRGKENAASTLLQLCITSPKYCRLVLQEGAVPPLVGLSQSGTPRAKEKAQQLLSHFRNQREGPSGRGNS